MRRALREHQYAWPPCKGAWVSEQPLFCSPGRCGAALFGRGQATPSPILVTAMPSETQARTSGQCGAHTLQVPRHTHAHTHTHTLCLPNMLDAKHTCTHVKAMWPNLGEGSCVDTDVPKKPHCRNHEAEKGRAQRDSQSLELR